MVIVIDLSCEALASVSVKTCTFRNSDYNLTQAIIVEHSFVVRADHEPVL